MEMAAISAWPVERNLCTAAGSSIVSPARPNALGRAGLTIEDPAAVHKFLSTGQAEMAAISMGAVLFGAATYIGNSPNFMIKAIAAQQKMHTPSFVGFIVKFSVPILLPVLLLVWWVMLLR